MGQDVRTTSHAASALRTALAAFVVFHLIGASVLYPSAARGQDFALPIAKPLLISQGAQPTAAWSRFCEQLAAECEVDLQEPDIVRMTVATWNAMVAVNRGVNATVFPVSDQDHWGIEDRWDYPEDGLGDCEDIQLLKRRRLSELGFPRRAMRMSVVVDREGLGHAVLMVLTDRGDFILDNKADRVLPWNETGYLYVKREGSHGPDWVTFGAPASPIVTANR